MPTLRETFYTDCMGYLDLRAIKDKKVKREAFMLDDDRGIKAFIKQHIKDHDLYFGVATRDAGGGKKENIVEIPAVWVDIDFKEIDRTEAERRLAEFPIKPTVIVESGGGLHIYYVFKEPCRKEDIEQCEAVMRGLAMRLGGDPASTDASRILRIPATRNQKYRPPRPVNLRYHSGSRYNLSDFDDFIVQQPETPSLKPRSTDNLNAIMTCKFMAHCRDDAASLKEPEWYAMVTILAREPGGIALIHEMSRPHKGYKKGHTDSKIMHALNDSGPMTCEAIKLKCGYDCGKQCKAKSPAALPFLVTSVTSVTPVTTVTEDEKVTSCNQVVTRNPKSVTTVTENFDLPLSVKGWLELVDGVFTIRDIESDLLSHIHPPLKPPLKNYLKQILYRLCEKREIERVGSIRGTYRKVDNNLEESPWWEADTEEYPILLPLGLTDLVKIMPKNIIVVAGEKSAAKSAFALNVAKLNIPNLQCRYFNSEGGPEEYKNRLMNFEDVDLSFWRKMPMYEKSQNIEDYIFPDDLNLVDYLEVNEDFFKVGLMIRKIYDRLNRGVAIINLQKDPNCALGRGSSMSIEKARLYLTLSIHKDDRGMIYNKATIVDAKTPRDRNRHPKSMVKTFRIHAGAVFSELSDWHFERGK